MLNLSLLCVHHINRVILRYIHILFFCFGTVRFQWMWCLSFCSLCFTMLNDEFFFCWSNNWTDWVLYLACSKWELWRNFGSGFCCCRFFCWSRYKKWKSEKENESSEFPSLDGFFVLTNYKHTIGYYSIYIYVFMGFMYFQCSV